jgi:hypothetical protein
VKTGGNTLLFYPVGPADSGLSREVHPITPVISGAYYLAGENGLVKRMIKELTALGAFFLIILAVIVPVAGSTGENPAGAGSDGTVTINNLTQVKYYIGEDTVTFSGTNTASGTTYLFITGPNLKTNGAQIQSIHPGQSPVIDGDASTFQAARVGPDTTWSYTWDTHNVMIDSGTYTVYAASTPQDVSHINSTHFNRVSFIMAPPKGMVRPVTAALSTGSDVSGATDQSERQTISRGDILPMPFVGRKGNTITISGTAKGNPQPGVAIWVIGAPDYSMEKAGYANQVVVRPDSTGFYSLNIDAAAANLREGNYHVIVQHPMQNNVLDIYLTGNTTGDATDGWVWNRMLDQNHDANGTQIFKVRGPGSLQGDDAYEALIQAFKDPGVDDVIAIAPSSVVTTTRPPVVTLTPTGSSDKVPGQQNTPAGGHPGKTTGSGNLLDQIFGFLSGIF